MAEPIFSVIIPVFNKWELTRNCLVSLKKYTKMSYEVIVIDNGSSDSTPKELPSLGKSLFGEYFTLIRNEKNQNFAPACNAGARVARAPLLFFLNNDTIVTEGWEYPLVNELNSSSDIGGVGSLLLYEDNTIQSIGTGWDLRFRPAHMYKLFPKDHRVALKKRQVQALTGAAFMMPTSLFFECGCFNEVYRNGYEDIDLSLQIINSGKKLYCIPESIIYHLESQTPGRSDYDDENYLLLINLCKNISVKVDKHSHALNDGFLPVLNNIFELAITLCDEEEQYLTSRFGSASIPVIYEILDKNLYWRHGRQLLLNFFEEKRDYEIAFEIAMYLAQNFPTEETLKKAYELYFLIHQKGEISSLAYQKKEERLQIIMKQFTLYKSSPALREKMIQRVHTIGEQQNDSFLLEEAERARKRMIL